MFHKQNLNVSKKYFSIIFICLVICIFLGSVGFASFSSELDWNLDIALRANSNMYITNLRLYNVNYGGYGNYSEYPFVVEYSGSTSQGTYTNPNWLYANHGVNIIKLSNGFTNSNSKITYYFNLHGSNFYIEDIIYKPGRSDVTYTSTCYVGQYVHDRSTDYCYIYVSTTNNEPFTEIGEIEFYFSENLTLSTKMLLDDTKSSNENTAINSIKAKDSPTFSTTNTGNGGLYFTRDDLGDSFYYNGSSAKNYVAFNNIMWRIIRRNGDGSVRMAYHGLLSDYTKSGNAYTAEPTTSAKLSIGSTKYASGTGSPNYVGYMNTGGNTINFNNNTSNSTLKTFIDTWYSNNMLNSVDANNIPIPSYLSDGIFCNDRGGKPSGKSNDFTFEGRNRYASLYATPSSGGPSLICERAADRFSVNTNIGNGKLTYPVATFTIDEAFLTGIGNGDNYNSNGYYFLTPPVTDQYYHTMTPGSISSTNIPFVVTTVRNKGYEELHDISDANTYAVPVINISKDVIVQSGDGSLSTPYVLTYRVVEPRIIQNVSKIMYQRNNPVSNLVSLSGGNNITLTVKEGNAVITNTNGLSLGNHTLTFIATNDDGKSTTKTFTFIVSDTYPSCRLSGPSTATEDALVSIVSNGANLSGLPYKFDNNEWTTVNSYVATGNNMKASIKDKDFGEIPCDVNISCTNQYRTKTCNFNSLINTNTSYGTVRDESTYLNANWYNKGLVARVSYSDNDGVCQYSSTLSGDSYPKTSGPEDCPSYSFNPNNWYIKSYVIKDLYLGDCTYGNWVSTPINIDNLTAHENQSSAIWQTFETKGVCKVGNIETSDYDTVISINSDGGNNISGITLGGNSVQQTNSGKNLLNPVSIGTSNGITTTINNQSISCSGTPSTTWADVTGNVYNLIKAGVYTFSINKSLNYSIILRLYGSDSNYTDFRILPGNKSTTITLTHDSPKYYIFLSGLQTSTSINISDLKVQLEAGDTATPYESYTGGVASPNPDYPQEIKVVTGEKLFNITGKNLFNYDYSYNHNRWNEEGNYEGYPVYKKDGAWGGLSHVPKIYNVGDVVTISLYAKASQNSSATFYTMITANNQNGYTTPGSSDISLTTSWQKFTFTFTVTRSGILGPRLEMRDQGVTMYVSQIQIEYGSTATSYEAFRGSNLSLNLGDIELASVGSTDDNIYYENGKWYLNKNIGKVVLNGSEPWIKSNNNFKTSITFPNDVALRDDTEFARSNYFIYEYIPSDITTRLSTLHFSWSGMKELNIRYETLGSVNNFTTWLQANQPVIYYKLETPIKEEITNTTLISQLNDIKNVVTNNGVNHIFVSNNVNNASDINPKIMISYVG